MFNCFISLFIGQVLAPRLQSCEIVHIRDERTNYAWRNCVICMLYSLHVLVVAFELVKVVEIYHDRNDRHNYSKEHFFKEVWVDWFGSISMLEYIIDFAIVLKSNHYKVIEIIIVWSNLFLRLWQNMEECTKPIDISITFCGFLPSVNTIHKIFSLGIFFWQKRFELTGRDNF